MSKERGERKQTWIDLRLIAKQTTMFFKCSKSLQKFSQLNPKNTSLKCPIKEECRMSNAGKRAANT